MDAKKLKEYRKKHNLTQKEMAVELGISRKTLNNYENGGNIPLAKEIMIEKLYGEILNHHHNDATNNTNSNNMNSLDSYSQDKINENNIYIEMIATQRELISQYRKEIEYLRRKLKENTENS